MLRKLSLLLIGLSFSVQVSAQNRCEGIFATAWFSGNASKPGAWFSEAALLAEQTPAGQLLVLQGRFANTRLQEMLIKSGAFELPNGDHTRWINQIKTYDGQTIHTADTLIAPASGFPTDNPKLLEIRVIRTDKRWPSEQEIISLMNVPLADPFYQSDDFKVPPQRLIKQPERTVGIYNQRHMKEIPLPDPWRKKGNVEWLRFVQVDVLP